ncbi:STAS domain-containing protein [Streptomyces sp. NBC_00503]|uniref:STAS domain-containing protein n=1 Tax=Streptomyces sp. NBC_00503 TaxID=2903659 RepID=UPI002E80249D|nr:STAS domain-containing protein [Streptomyces sp. NBC_00503]WUD79206.1 STAS domain-containing protein [Streptomyces sp. NBC_00503]
MTVPHRHTPSASPVGPETRQDDCAETEAGVRRGQGRTGTDPATALTSQRLRDRPGARLSGSCDLDSRQALRDALGVVTGIPGPVVHLDLSAVVFLDPAAVAALLKAASELNGQGRRLLLHDPPYSLRKVVEMFPDECAALEVAA